MVRKSSSLGFILKRLMPYAFVLEGFKFYVWIQKIGSFIYIFAFFLINWWLLNWNEFFWRFWLRHKITCVARLPVTCIKCVADDYRIASLPKLWKLIRLPYLNYIYFNVNELWETISWCRGSLIWFSFLF